MRENETSVENILWYRLRNRCLGVKFYRQFSVGPYILDFYCFACRLAIELDGSQHLAEDQAQYDDIRTKFLSDHSIKVIRFWNNYITENIDGALEEIVREIKNRK